jgi:signal transduction histidine kinase
MTGGEDAWRRAIASAQENQDALQRAGTARGQVALTAEAAAEAQEQLAVSMDRLAELMPRDAARLRHLSALSRERAARRRRWAREHASGGTTAAADNVQVSVRGRAAVSFGSARDAAAADRDRIAAQLQDKIIQRVFAAGLMLDSAAGLTERPEARRRIEAAIYELDQAIKEIRTAIFDVEPHRQSPGLRQGILDVSALLAPEAEVSFSGPGGDSPDPAAGPLRETLREALTLISEYATAKCINVSSHDLMVEASPLSSAVTAGEPADWFSNLRTRAAQAGIHIDTQAPSGSIRASAHLRG